MGKGTKKVFALREKALYGNFRHPERQPERDYVIELMKSCGMEGDTVPSPIYYEGSGETMIWRDKILFGFGQRSHEEAQAFLESIDSRG